MKTIKEIAEYFKVHFRTVYVWIKEGKIKAVKVSQKLYISNEEFERMKNEGIR